MGTTNKLRYKVILFLLFTASFFAVRIPLLGEDFGLEEGIFAELTVNRPCGPYYSLGGRIDGQKKYGLIHHPAVPYELLRLGGYVSRKFLSRDVYLNDSIITPRLRIIYAFYQFIFWSFLLLYVFLKQSVYGKWPVFLIFVVILSPLAVKTSVHLQIDNTSGLILCGIAAFLFTIAAGPIHSKPKKYILLFSGGVIAGLGKQEWSFALLAAIFSMFLLSRLLLLDLSFRHQLKMLGCVATGLLVSNGISYLYDPSNYLSGLHYIGVFSKSHAISHVEGAGRHWLLLTKLRAPFIYICILLLLLSLYAVIFRKKKEFSFYLTSLFGFFLFVGYVLSNWNYSPRYFCPSLAVLTVSAMTLSPNLLPQRLRITFFAGVVLVFASTIVFLVGYVPNENRELEMINNGTMKSSPDTVLYITSGAGWNKPDIDYVNNNNPYDKVKKGVFEKYNKKLVRPEDVVAK